MLGDVRVILTLVPFQDQRIYSIAVYTRNLSGRVDRQEMLEIVLSLPRRETPLVVAVGEPILAEATGTLTPLA